MFARNVFRALLLCGVALVSACGGETVSGEAATGDDDPGSSTKAAPASIILSSSSSQLPADADTQAEGVTLAAIVLDAGGRTIEDVDVTFARTGCGAIIVTEGTTDSSGVAQAVLRATSTCSVGQTISVTAIAGSVNDSTTITVVVAGAAPTTASVDDVALYADSSFLFSDADEQSEGVTLTASVTDANGNTVSGVPVSFAVALVSGSGSPGRLLVTNGTTGAAGTATAVLMTNGNTSARTIRVTATATDDSSTYTATADVSVVGRASTIIGVLSSNLLFADDGVPVTITARATDSTGNVVANVPITITASSGALSVTGGISNGPRSVTVVTDDTGETSSTPITLTTGGDATPRIITITPSAPSVSSITTGTVQVVKAVSSVNLSKSASSLFADAAAVSQGVTVSARVTASDGSMLANVPIKFSVSNSAAGRNGAIQTASATTDSTGTATTVLTVGTAQATDVLTVTATFDRTSATDTAATVTVPVVARVASVTLLASAPELPSNADTFAEGVTFTALVKDGNNNLVSGIDVSFSSDLGALQVTSSTTDTTGTANTVLHTGGNPRNQNITVTATAQGQSGTFSIPVTGTALRISGASVVGSGDTETYTITLVDSANAGIPNQSVTITSASLGNPLDGTSGPVTKTTDTDGQVTVTYTGTSGGTDTLQVSSIGVAAEQEIGVSQFKLVFNTPASAAEVPFRAAFDPAPDPTADDVTVTLTQNGTAVAGATIQFGTTRGTLSATTATTNASGQATVNLRADGAGAAGGAVISATDTSSEVSASRSIEFVATTPSTVTLQAEPAIVPINGTSTITAVVRDANGNLVKNQRVNFALSDATGASLSAQFGETDSLGTTSVTFSATGTASSNEGVTVTATVDGTAIADTATLTVGGQALRIILGTGNEIGETGGDNGNTVYLMPWVAIVTDAAGNPPPANTVFRISVEPVAYQKGVYALNADDIWVPIYSVTGADLQASGLSPQPRDFGCINEDINRDGNTQAGEDFNGNSSLDPGGVASVLSSPELNDDGTAFFDVIYGQIYSNWVMVRLKAVASVQGSETTSYVDFVLPVLASDVNDPNTAPPGISRGSATGSPYGEATTCNDPD